MASEKVEKWWIIVRLKYSKNSLDETMFNKLALELGLSL